MTVLVTGASGIVGRPLISHLLSQGHKVIGLCRHPDQTKNESQLEWLPGDVSKPHLGLSDNIWQSLCQEIKSIFHLAARTDFKGQSLGDYSDVNINGVRHIKELALSSNAWLHHVSTAFVCGKWSGEFQESQLRAGQSFHNYYEESKYLGEKILRQEPTPRHSIYRPSIILERSPSSASSTVFGPFVFIDGVFRLCLGAVKKGSTLETIRVRGNSKAHLPLIFDDEIASTLATLAQNHASHGSVYHLTPRVPLSNMALEQVFNRAFSKKVATFVNDDFLEDNFNAAEKLLSRKTKMYASYLNLNTTFSRKNLVEALGEDILPAINEEELLAAFSTFLATKKDLDTVVGPNKRSLLDHYFNDFLKGHMGQRLIPNLTSLSACLTIEIKGYSTWTITIKNGVLTGVTEEDLGDFGYITDGKTFLHVVSGRLSPQNGFFQGAIQLVSNPKEALRTASALEEFFNKYPFIIEGDTTGKGGIYA